MHLAPRLLLYTAKRFSHVGKRAITVDPMVTIDILKPEAKRCAFGQTPVHKIVKVSGPLGSLTFPIHYGLDVLIEPGTVEGEQVIRVLLQSELVNSFSKYCQSFVHSMWGTTATILRNNVEGVSEVLLHLVA